MLAIANIKCLENTVLFHATKFRNPKQSAPCFCEKGLDWSPDHQVDSVCSLVTRKVCRARERATNRLNGSKQFVLGS